MGNPKSKCDSEKRENIINNTHLLGVLYEDFQSYKTQSSREIMRAYNIPVDISCSYGKEIDLYTYFIFLH